MIRREAALLEAEGEHRFEPEVNPAPHLFHETVFAVHTAVRVSCEAAKQAADGLPTWSISTAHHASMFALRALFGLCGIAYLDTAGCYLLMDTFPSAKKGKRSRRRPVLNVFNNEVQLIKVPRMEHRHWWLLFQRLLRTSEGLFSRWSYPLDAALAHCNAQVLSRHRNELHYRGAWFFEDLFDQLEWTSFGRFEPEACRGIVGKLEERNGSDGTLILNQVLLGITIAMLRDLARDSRRVEPEVRVIDRTIRRFENAVVSTWPSAEDSRESLLG